jgi:thioredoxin reductase (NADPH)
MPVEQVAEQIAANLGADDVRFQWAFPTLNSEQVTFLEKYGRRLLIPEGGEVWVAGQPNVCMFVVVRGEMTILDGRTGHFVARHMEGGFSGDIDVLSGRPTIVSASAATELEVLEVQGDCVRSIVGERPDLGDLILRAFLMRRALLQETTNVGPLLVGSRFCPDTLRIREFLSRNRYPYTWEDLEQNPETTKILQEFHVTEQQTPVVVLPNGRLLRVPSNLEIAEGLGIKRPIVSKIYDLAVIGAGPAGLAAGVYGGSEGLSTLVIDSTGPGGQAGTSSRIENYMGFPTGLSGQDLADRAVAQAERFGAEMIVPATVTDITCDEAAGHIIHLEEMEPIQARCVILATGASYRKLDAPGMSFYEGRGIFYAATNVERVLCHDDAVAVVGAGNSAGQAAVFLAENARHVFLIVRGDDLRKNMSSYLASRIERSDKITVLLHSEISEIRGENYVDSITIKTAPSGEVRSEEVGAIFVMIGAVPHTSWLPESIVRDSRGFILSGQQLVQEKKWKLDRPPLYLETSCPGVFAAGDARAASVKRVASAVGEGSMAVAFVHQFLALA